MGAYDHKLTKIRIKVLLQKYPSLSKYIIIERTRLIAIIVNVLVLDNNAKTDKVLIISREIENIIFSNMHFTKENMSIITGFKIKKVKRIFNEFLEMGTLNSLADKRYSFPKAEEIDF